MQITIEVSEETLVKVNRVMSTETLTANIQSTAARQIEGIANQGESSFNALVRQFMDAAKGTETKAEIIAKAEAELTKRQAPVQAEPAG